MNLWLEGIESALATREGLRKALISMPARTAGNIDARLVAYLLAVAEHGSFIAAADALGISQPALSNSIALLERRLGVRVLERSHKGSTLNDYGEILVRRAASIRSLLGQAERRSACTARACMAL